MFPMLKIVLKSLFQKPSTVAFPAKPVVNDELVRGRVEIEVEKCVFCGLCYNVCPTNAITLDKPGKVWTIRRFDCIACGYCVEKCPKKCLRMSNTLPSASADRHGKDVFSEVNA
ncbi:NADH-quinone oxidoreductase subunit I 1 [Clostridia bacterium]|nr:NADH-quinone oxidoreductase subunit I 1 [Clostridia bacterium]